jgi:hypothetical protein
VEISDQPKWDDSPIATANREVQGKLLAWSDTTITFELYQGAFTSLSGKYMYIIDGDGNVNANGYALSGSTIFSVIPDIVSKPMISPNSIIDLQGRTIAGCDIHRSGIYFMLIKQNGIKMVSKILMGTHFKR